MCARDQALLIKGYLMASNAPVPVLVGIELILKELGGGQSHRHKDRDIDLPAAPKKSVQILKTSEDRVQKEEEIEPEDTKSHVSIHSDEEKIQTDQPKKERKRPELTPEQRQAQSDRAKAMQARRKAEREAAAAPDTSDTDLSDVQKAPAARVDTAPDKLIRDHGEYIGQRTDRTLVDADWGDIQRMRYNGMPDARIAKHYGIGEDYLLRFAKQQEQREKLGNR